MPTEEALIKAINRELVEDVWRNIANPSIAGNLDAADEQEPEPAEDFIKNIDKQVQ